MPARACGLLLGLVPDEIRQAYLQKGLSPMNNLIDKARHIPVREVAPAASVNPIILPAPARSLPLEMRVTAPMNGDSLPIILLSHGGGASNYLSSKDGYAPLSNFYAEQGFVVIQPTHLSSRVGGFGLDPSRAGFPIFWESRVKDMKLILDSLDEIEARIPFISGRLDHERVGVVGHSGGAHTAALLLGAGLPHPQFAEAERDTADIRIKAGVLMAALGNGGDDLAEPLRGKLPELDLDYSQMATRTLVVFGDADVNPHLTVRGADWHADAFHHGPGADCLLTLFGAKHFLGGVMGYDAKETDDENPDHLAITQRMTSAYLRSALFEKHPAWQNACKAFGEHAASLGSIDCK
jgi:predicted dienelactone hydrolase